MRSKMIRPVIVSTTTRAVRCGHGIPVKPDRAIDRGVGPRILIAPELWLAPSGDLLDRYSACSGSALLAAAGLLDGCAATSHWGYQDLFRTHFPKVRFDPALHIISRHCSPDDALRIAKVYLLKRHGEGQLPYASLVRRRPHADAVVREAEDWLAARFREPHAVSAVVNHCAIPERSLKRRFTTATGASLMMRVQNLRIEDAKRQLESSARAIEEVAEAMGYENHAFFRRLFRRCTGLTPGAYRHMFGEGR